MKNNNTCPKCGSKDIIIVPGTASNYGSNNHIKVGWSIYSAIMINRYLCCGCGYSEEWVDKKDIEAVREYVNETKGR